MTLDDFLCWDDGTETHYELIGGFAVAMAPPAEAHRILAMRLGSRIDSALSNRRPCNAQIEAGVIRPDRADSYFEADIAATCPAKAPDLSPDRNGPVDPADRLRRALRRAARRSGAQWITEIERGSEGMLNLASVGLEVPFSELYQGIALAGDAER
jgi:hypothetical protein